MSDAVFKKKVHPNPILRSVEAGTPIRPLAPWSGSAEVRGCAARKVVVPLAVAAALALGISGCSNKTPIEREGGSSKGSTTQHATQGGDSTDFVDVIKNFISPEKEPPRLAGEIEPVAPPSTVAPVNTVAPNAGPSNTFITPTPNPPRLAGDVAEPSIPPPPSTNASPTNTVASPPPPPPTSITPNPGHPKLGGKPVAHPPGGTI